MRVSYLPGWYPRYFVDSQIWMHDSALDAIQPFIEEFFMGMQRLNFHRGL